MVAYVHVQRRTPPLASLQVATLKELPNAGCTAVTYHPQSSFSCGVPAHLLTTERPLVLLTSIYLAMSSGESLWFCHEVRNLSPLVSACTDAPILPISAMPRCAPSWFVVLQTSSFCTLSKHASQFPRCLTHTVLRVTALL